MKKAVLLLFALQITLASVASDLVLIPTGSMELTKLAFCQKGLTINFYNDRFVIGTADQAPAMKHEILLENAWSQDDLYYILHFNPSQRDNYLASIRDHVRLLFQDNDFAIVAVPPANSKLITPAIRGGIVRVNQTAARFPSKSLSYKKGSLNARNEIWAMIAQVDTARLRQLVQHLQDFGTRNAYKPGSIQAQNWIYSKFDSLGLDVELHDFSMPGGPASDNVIATLTGTKYPDEYVVLGAHYDSYAGGSYEPGADDNATGTAGILEIARILSQYEFDRSIIFCTWSGEEYGLYGSEAWANEAAQNGMNILGYFNIDMAGYLEPGSYIHTDLIGPASASELKQFYTDVCSIYLPDFPVEPGALSGGDSDHTSFNNAGYQGIFPFEDSQNYSPYIHSTSDVIGLSANNFEQHGIFVQATLASVATMADLLPSPDNLVGMADDELVTLTWSGVDSVDYYNIYRNGDSTAYASSTELTYADTNVTNGETYTYYVTAVFLNSGEESGPSNQVTVVPMPPIAFPFYDDFETGGPYWSFEGSWGLQDGIYHSATNSMTESPGGNYLANLDISSTLRALNLTGATSAQLSFWTRYQLESGYDFTYLEVSTDGSDWDQLASYTGNQNTWTQLTYSLNNYLNKENVIIRFRFTSDSYIEAQGMFIDDIEIDVVGVGINESAIAEASGNIMIRPNPAGGHASLDMNLTSGGKVKITLNDATGKTIRILHDQWLEAGTHQINLDLSTYPDGTYFIVTELSAQRTTNKLVISR